MDSPTYSFDDTDNFPTPSSATPTVATVAASYGFPMRAAAIAAAANNLTSNNTPRVAHMPTSTAGASPNLAVASNPTTAAPSFPKQGRAFVKSVLSADTIVLRANAGKTLPPPEKVFSFSNVNAPRMGSVKESSREDPHAYESREYLRTLLVGKEVAYRVEYNAGSRTFGSITLSPVMSKTLNGESNLTRLLVKNGIVKVRANDRDHGNEELLALTELETEAQSEKRGLWAFEDDATVSKVTKYNLEEEAHHFLAKYKGKPLDAVVEQVRDGSTLRVACALPGTNVIQYITLFVSGIKAPSARQDDDQSEPFAAEARFFVELRLLQKDVKVVLEGLSSNSSAFVGSVLFPAGNIAEALLSEGLAKVTDWTISTLSGGAQQAIKLRNAERQAKDARLRLWREYQSARSSEGLAAGSSSFDGIVLRIVTADTLLVENSKTKAEVKVTLSSVRQPKLKGDAKESYFNSEAKEFLRRRLIGRPVSVLVDYVKPANEENGVKYDEKLCATVKVNNGQVNVAEKLIEKGFAYVMRHRKDDDDRSREFDALLMAETKAKEEQLGLFSPKDVPTLRVTDASENSAKAKTFLPFYQRGGQLIPAVVEHVISASRFKVFIPKEQTKLTFVLGGIRAPRSGRNPSDKGEPFGQEALDWANRRILQRDVFIQVDNIDKSGGFIGFLFLNDSSPNKGSQSQVNVAVELCKVGYAYVHDYSASQSKYARELNEAQQAAKGAVRGVWSLPDFAATLADDDTNDNDSLGELETLSLSEGPILPIAVSDVKVGGRLSVQVLGEGTKKLEGLMSKFALFHQDVTNVPISQPSWKNGDVCSAKFTEDDAWYRAKIVNLSSDKKTATVVYIDYGNSESISVTRLRPLPSAFSIAALPAQSSDSQLAYLEVPNAESEYGYDSMDKLREILESAQDGLHMQVVRKVQGVQQVVIFKTKDAKPESSVNAELVKSGLATVKKDVIKAYEREQREMAKKTVLGGVAVGARPKKNAISVVVDAQDSARRKRLNMWRYGDFTNDE